MVGCIVHLLELGGQVQTRVGYVVWRLAKHRLSQKEPLQEGHSDAKHIARELCEFLFDLFAKVSDYPLLQVWLYQKLSGLLFHCVAHSHLADHVCSHTLSNFSYLAGIFVF